MSGKISADPSAGVLDGTELIAVVQGGLNKTATPATIKTYVGPTVVDKAAVLAALGLTDIIVTDTTITFSKLGADLVTRQTILDLELPV